MSANHRFVWSRPGGGARIRLVTCAFALVVVGALFERRNPRHRKDCATVGVLGWIVSLLLWTGPTRWSSLRRWTTLGAVMLFYAGALWLGLKLGWPALEERMTDFQAGLEAREQMFDTARPMAADYPWFGTGAGKRFPERCRRCWPGCVDGSRAGRLDKKLRDRE